MLGIIRPSSVTVAFQCWKLASRSAMSCPRSATRTGWRRLGRDAVLVPGDVPGERQHHLGVDARERRDRGLRLPERLGDAGDRAAELGRVEELGRLDERDLVVAEPAQDRLADDRLRLLLASSEQRLPERPLAAPARPAAAASARPRRPPSPSRGRPRCRSRAGRRRRTWCRRASSAARARPAAASARRRRRFASPWS